MMAAPYDLGQALLAVAVQQGGDDEVDNLFRSPPKTEEQQLDPWTLLADHQGVLTVPKPDLPDGAKSFDDGAFGALTWLMLLSERLPTQQALTAVDGWGGDSYAAYDQDGVSCVTVNYRGDTPEDLAQMQSALQAWAEKGPKGSASVTKQDLTLVFSSCDPGKKAAKVASGKSMDGVALALSRTYLSLELVKGGMDVKVARCGADRLVREFTHRAAQQPPPGQGPRDPDDPAVPASRPSLTPPYRDETPSSAGLQPSHASQWPHNYIIVVRTTSESSGRARWGRRSSRRGRRRR